MQHIIKHKTSKWKAVFAPILLWSILITIGYSHGDEEHGATDATTTTISSSDSSSKTDEELALFSAALDSVYAAIGVSYNTVKPMLITSCYDCHSAQGKLPWYQSLPIIKQMIMDDIEEARKHLDMEKDFPFGGHATQLAQLEEIKEEVSEGEMPIFAYRMMHWGTLIEGEKQQKLFNWIENSATSIKEVYSLHQMQLPTENEHGDNDDDDDDEDGD